MYKSEFGASSSGLLQEKENDGSDFQNKLRNKLLEKNNQEIGIDLRNYLSPPTSSLRNYMGKKSQENSNRNEEFKLDESMKRRQSHKPLINKLTNFDKTDIFSSKIEKKSKKNKITGKLYSTKYAFKNTNNNNRVKNDTSNFKNLTEKGQENRTLKSKLQKFRKNFDYKNPRSSNLSQNKSNISREIKNQII